MELVKSRTGTGLRSGDTLVLLNRDGDQNSFARWVREFPTHNSSCVTVVQRATT
jgi:hypothetical protein